MPTTIGLDNPHDEDTLLHQAWEQGAQAAQDGVQIEREMDLDDPRATMAFVQGYMRVIEGI